MFIPFNTSNGEDRYDQSYRTGRKINSDERKKQQFIIVTTYYTIQNLEDKIHT